MDQNSGNNDPESSSSVNVAVRVRPLNATERINSPQICITCDHDRNTIIMGKDREFVFDRIFGMDSKQIEVFSSCAKDLVLSCFEGYNATILAYGQTGSGKTHTMGTGQSHNMLEEELGIIPRVIHQIFEEVDVRKTKVEFVIKVSFLEIYNEEIHDLLGANSMVPEKTVSIREDKGSIILTGLHEETVTNFDEMITCLNQGSMQRCTSSTLMNAQSSRSHAIFTINIEQTGISEENADEGSDEDHKCAKFHFVDLAGSERAKRTGAVGATLKEGININKGLLCLGNVISALTEESKKNKHIPYRDSKLTRILQDSLGGNAKTFMIACISPAEINFDETLNTLKYASRARHIKNKPVVNRDPQSALIAQLKQELLSAKQEIKNYQRLLSLNDNEEIKKELMSMKSGNFQENNDDERKIKLKCEELERKVKQLTNELENAKSSTNSNIIEIMQYKKERDIYKFRLENYTEILRKNQIEIPEETGLPTLLEEYSLEIENLRTAINEKDRRLRDLRIEFDTLTKQYEKDEELLAVKTEELEKLRRQKGTVPIVIENVEELMMKNVDNYGKLFAESLFAKLDNPDTPSTANEEIIEGENTENAESPEPGNEVEHEELLQVDKSLKEKEEMLKSIEDVFRSLQGKLVSEMSQQYYMKIEELEGELQTTQNERARVSEKMKNASALDRQNAEEKFKLKIEELEEKLRENRSKEKEQASLSKVVETQKKELTKLADEITKAKQQRVSLLRKIKEDSEAHQKWKTSRQKELLQLKRINLKKDQEILKLQSDNRKKEIVAKRKSEELSALQKRQREIALRRKNTHFKEDKETLINWVAEFADACVEERELRAELQADSTEKEKIEEEIKNLNRQYALTKLKIEKLEMIIEDPDSANDELDLQYQIQESKSDLNDFGEQLENLEVKLRFKQEKILGISEKLANSEVEAIKSRSLTLHSIEDANYLIEALFDDIINKASQAKKVSKILDSKKEEIEKVTKSLSENIHDKEIMKKHHEQIIIKIRREYDERISQLIEELEMKSSLDTSEMSETRISELESKEKEGQLAYSKLKKEYDTLLVKYTKLKATFLELKENAETKLQDEMKLRPRSSTNTITSLARAREQAKMKKDTPLEIEEEFKRPRQSFHGGSLLKAKFSRTFTENFTDESVWKRLQKSNSQRVGLANQPEISSNLFSLSQKWSCLRSIDAHTGAVCGMTAHENILYTASNKTFKIWSLDTFGVIKEVLAHPSFIKSIAYSSEKNLIFSGCNKEIGVWDSVSLQNVSLLKGHNEELKCLQVKDNYLYSAGKSSNSSGSIFIWDLRRYNTPIQEKENNQDIFQILVKENILYYGSRNHRVGRINLKTYDSMRTYEPPHFDAVTSLAIYNNTIISGSRDKNMRRWDLIGESPYPTILSAHTDWINCLATEPNEKFIYSAGKEGKIRVWKGGRNLRCVGEMAGHVSSINCMTPIRGFETELVSGGTDKTIKIWRLTEEDLESDHSSDDGIYLKVPEIYS